MTRDEIKQTYSMTDIVRRYGLQPDRSGFIRCPFHVGDNNASLKIYKDSFYCFGCGANGDIFEFVMLMDGVSFRDAYLSLGGEYTHAETKNDARHRKRDILIAEQKRRNEEQKIRQMKQDILHYGEVMDENRECVKAYKPLSDPWCECMEGYLEAMYKYDSLREEVSKNGRD